MRQKRMDEFIKNHEMFVQELLEYAKNDPKSFREAIAEIIRVISDYKALINRVRELEKRLKIYQKRSWFEDYEKVAKQNKRYREALEFYADEDNHDFEIDVTTSHLDVNSPILNDRGEKARKALEGEE